MDCVRYWTAVLRSAAVPVIAEGAWFLYPGFCTIYGYFLIGKKFCSKLDRSVCMLDTGTCVGFCSTWLATSVNPTSRSR